jgi:FlaA1/EpsC-like NDP-sugar epimerase
MDLKLNDKVVFISGSTAGIGFAIAKRFLSEGARVIINGRTKESVDKRISLKICDPLLFFNGLPPLRKLRIRLFISPVLWLLQRMARLSAQMAD